MPDLNDVVSGKVTAIMNFGAFVQLEDGSSGLVHISEISSSFVRDVKEYLTIGQDVRVISLATDHDGKKRLSIKKADEILKLNGDPNVNEFRSSVGATLEEKAERKAERPKKKERKIEEDRVSRQNLISQPPPMFDEFGNGASDNFEDRLSKYMKLSEERLIDVKRQSENKRGGGYIRRG